MLVLTVDVPVSGRASVTFEVVSQFPAPSPRTLLNGVLHPTWSRRFLTSEPITFANVTIGPTAPVSVMEQIHQMFDPSVEWSDVEWMLEQWNGPMLLKGIMSAADARRAADVGVAGVVVSNHGGRQLDRAPATLDVLPEIVEAVGDRVDVLFDGGIRRGSDVVTALALGAKAAMVGRAYLYGLGAASAASRGRSRSSTARCAAPWRCSARAPSPSSACTCSAAPGSRTTSATGCSCSARRPPVRKAGFPGSASSV